MKILITGYTSRMVKSPRTRWDYITFSNLLPLILKEMGHEVDQRVATVGEELAGIYNYAFCGLAPLSSITSGKVPETHFVIDQMRGRCSLFADDWSFCNYRSSVEYSLKRWEGYCKYRKFPYNSDVIEEFRKQLETLLYTRPAGNNPPLLAPMFKWGDHSLLINKGLDVNIVSVDPSAWVKFPTVVTLDKEDKKKQWVSATLSDHTPWLRKQGFEFPILHLGSKRLGPSYTESGVVQSFAESFGSISVGYASAGSGWWRTRYLNSAWAETPIYSDPRDQVTMGNAFHGKPGDFEREFGTPNYDARVGGQREFLEQNISSKEEVMATLEALLNA